MIIKQDQYIVRARRLATINTQPSETDQSGAEDTDINVIVKRYGVFGTVPSGTKTPNYGADLSEVPTDLRDMIEAARMLEIYRGELPESLRALNVNDLLTLTPAAIAAILNPPAPPAHKEIP